MKTLELSEGTFRIEILDIPASHDHVAGYVHLTGSARGKILDDYPVHPYRVNDEGLIAEITQYPLNHSNVNDFWS
jgi:hypothetical protein